VADDNPNREGLFLTVDEHGNQFIAVVRWLYNVILALIFAVAVVAFYAGILVIICVLIQIAISLLVGISNPIPFAERF
jgi:hypothetical protein